MPIMEDDPDSYVKTITEVIKEPREDKKIINSVIKEILINWELCVQNNDKFCVEKVSINWKLYVQKNLSTLCFESL